ncbi:uncharacterized protein LOC121997329 [Zingiber officinale]|uniref:uncharacterized protein LOC121997329 n=1 Tax=Zingiber officinale TaxID=94328 RepID=UPI001C4DD0DE|nr:uncharacterized protein LOC121997329 [Zingiber officinale]
MEISSSSFLSSFLLLLLLSSSLTSATDSTNNPADQLVAVINTNRTSSNSPRLFDNAGLGCIALEYIKGYNGECNKVGEMMRPPNSSFTDTFAPNCGVEVATLAPISGRLIACQSSYASPQDAFNILVDDARSLQILHNRNHTTVGAAVSGTDGGSPYFWCVLFSNGKGNNSFVLEGGVAKDVHPGCFSGNNDDCSAAKGLSKRLGVVVATMLVTLAYVFGL